MTVATGEEIYDAVVSVLRGPEVADARLIRLHRHLWLRATLHGAEDHSALARHRDYLYLLPPGPPLGLAETNK